MRGELERRLAELSVEYIIPSVFDRRVAVAVAKAVAHAAVRTGVARRRARPTPAMIEDEHANG